MHLSKLALSAAVALSFATFAGRARATGALSGGDHVPIEQRVAVSLGPQRTTLWTQLRLRTEPGPLAIVVPAPVGATLDWASPAWMEALDLATAPRIRPPSGVVPACPGHAPADDLVEIVAETSSWLPLTPLEVVVLPDAEAVTGWATSHGMTVPPPLQDAMVSLSGQHFVAARFDAPDGEALTPTLRVVAPSPTPVLPLVLSRAATEDVLVTAFTLAEGRTALDGPVASLDATALTYDATDATTTYRQARWAALTGAGPSSSLLECATRSALADDVAVGVGGQIIKGAIATYFTRAATYAGGGFDPAGCLATVGAGVDTPAPVALACPRGDLGVIGGADDCSEMVAAGQVDPELLRCGTVADDLAVALSGQIASDAWLSRHSAWIPMALSGEARAVSPAPGPAKQPIFDAQSLDTSGCEDGEGGSGAMGTGPGPAGDGAGEAAGGSDGVHAPSSTSVPVYEVDSSGCGTSHVGAVPILYVDADDSDAPDGYYVDEGDDCGGDTSDAYGSDSYHPVYDDDAEGDGVVDDIEAETEGDDCGGDTSDAYEGDAYEDEGDCGGDTTDSYEDDAYEDEDCGGDTTDSYEDDAYEDEGDCGGDTTDTTSDTTDDCGGDTSDTSEGDCSISRGRRHRRPRLSLIVMLLFGLIAPLRRLTRPRRRRRRRRAPHVRHPSPRRAAPHPAKGQANDPAG